jgi:hypothetical protein
MTREEMKKYLEDRKVEVVLDDEEDLILDGIIIATMSQAYLKVIRTSTKFKTSSDGVDIDNVTEKDLEKFISARAWWYKNYDKRIRRERISLFRKAVKQHREKKDIACLEKLT